mgnify:CR=1 FL=1
MALSDSKMIKATANEIKIMHTKCMGPDDMISSLSGGNQQKVIFGKWLERSPQVFMRTSHARHRRRRESGDYELMNKLVKEGKSIIMIPQSSPRSCV